jgi:hypothetical protein
VYAEPGLIFEQLVEKENVMNPRILMLTSFALLSWIPSSANAGPCATEIDNITKSLAAADAGSGPTLAPGTTRTQAPSASSGQHPPTEVMGRETQGKATSDQDVRRQTQGQPTAEEQGRRGARANDKMAQVDSALQRARAFDGQGKEPECMESVREAKELLGQR